MNERPLICPQRLLQAGSAPIASEVPYVLKRSDKRTEYLRRDYCLFPACTDRLGGICSHRNQRFATFLPQDQGLSVPMLKRGRASHQVLRLRHVCRAPNKYSGGRPALFVERSAE